MPIAAAWGLGSFATTTMLNGVSVVLLFFLVNYIKLEPVVAGALLFGSKLLDVVTDPPMGLLSDRTRSRFGRRRPYMAMPAEMTVDWHERTHIMSWRVVFMSLGTMAGAAGVPALVKLLGEDRAAYGKMGWIAGAVIGISMFMTFLGTAGARQTVPSGHSIPLARQLAWLRQNRPLLVLMGMKVATWALATPDETMLAIVLRGIVLGACMYLGFIWIPVACQLAATALRACYRLERRDLE